MTHPVVQSTQINHSDGTGKDKTNLLTVVTTVITTSMTSGDGCGINRKASYDVNCAEKTSLPNFKKDSNRDRLLRQSIESWVLPKCDQPPEDIWQHTSRLIHFVTCHKLRNLRVLFTNRKIPMGIRNKFDEVINFLNAMKSIHPDKSRELLEPVIYSLDRIIRNVKISVDTLQQVFELAKWVISNESLNHMQSAYLLKSTLDSLDRIVGNDKISVDTLQQLFKSAKWVISNESLNQMERAYLLKSTLDSLDKISEFGEHLLKSTLDALHKISELDEHLLKSTLDALPEISKLDKHLLKSTLDAWHKISEPGDISKKISELANTDPKRQTEVNSKISELDELLGKHNLPLDTHNTICNVVVKLVTPGVLNLQDQRLPDWMIQILFERLAKQNRLPIAAHLKIYHHGELAIRYKSSLECKETEHAQRLKLEIRQCRQDFVEGLASKLFSPTQSTPTLELDTLKMFCIYLTEESLKKYCDIPISIAHKPIDPVASIFNIQTTTLSQYVPFMWAFEYLKVSCDTTDKSKILTDVIQDVILVISKFFVEGNQSADDKVSERQLQQKLELFIRAQQDWEYHLVANPTKRRVVEVIDAVQEDYSMSKEIPAISQLVIVNAQEQDAQEQNAQEQNAEESYVRQPSPEILRMLRNKREALRKSLRGASAERQTDSTSEEESGQSQDASEEESAERQTKFTNEE